MISTLSIIRPETSTSSSSGPSQVSPESLNVPSTSFPAIGGTFPHSADSKGNVQANVTYLQQELKRWERSIAFVHESALPAMTETETLHDMLDILRPRTTSENFSSVQQALETCLIPLQPWTASIIRTEESHESLYYSVSLSLLGISQLLLSPSIGLEVLNEKDPSGEQGEYVVACEELAKGYIETKDITAVSNEEIGDPNAERLRKWDRVRAVTRTLRGRVALGKMGSPPRFG